MVFSQIQNRGKHFSLFSQNLEVDKRYVCLPCSGVKNSMREWRRRVRQQHRKCTRLTWEAENEQRKISPCPGKDGWATVCGVEESAWLSRLGFKTWLYHSQWDFRPFPRSFLIFSCLLHKMGHGSILTREGCHENFTRDFKQEPLG